MRDFLPGNPRSTRQPPEQERGLHQGERECPQLLERPGVGGQVRRPFQRSHEKLAGVAGDAIRRGGGKPDPRDPTAQVAAASRWQLTR